MTERSAEEIVKAKWPSARLSEHYSGDAWAVVNQDKNEMRFPPEAKFMLSKYFSSKDKAWANAAARIKASEKKTAEEKS